MRNGNSVVFLVSIWRGCSAGSLVSLNLASLRLEFKVRQFHFRPVAIWRECSAGSLVSLKFSYLARVFRRITRVS